MASIFPFSLYFDSPVSEEEIFKIAEKEYWEQKKWVVEYKIEKWLQKHSKGVYFAILTKFNY